MSALLTPSQAAERMGITVKTVYQYLNKGQLEGAFKDDRGRWQIPESAIVEPEALNPVSVEETSQEPPDQSASVDESSEQVPEDLDDAPPAAPVVETSNGAQQEEGSQPMEVTPEERAAQRERERAAALAALYSRIDADDEPPSEEPAPVEAVQDDAGEDEQYARDALEREAEMEGLYARDERDVNGEAAATDQAEERGAEEEPPEPADESVTATKDEQQDSERRNAAGVIAGTSAAADEAQVQTEAAPAPNFGDDEDGEAETDESMQPDEYVMDFVPVEPEVEEVEVITPVPQAVQIPSDALAASDADMSDIDLAGVDLAKVAPRSEPPADEEDEEAAAAEDARRSGIGCPVLIAIAATLVVLLIAGAFIANQSLGLWNRSTREVAELATPMVIAPSEEATTEQATTEQAEPAVEAEAPASPESLEQPSVILPQADGESLLILPAFAGANTEINQLLRDAIAAQASAFGLQNLRAETEPSTVAADQLSQAVDLGAQYLADMIMWGEDAGDGAVVNLLSLKSAGLPVAEVSDTASAERVQPLPPSGYASFGVEDASSQADFLAGVAVAQASILSGNYEQAAGALQQAVDSLDPEAALPTGLDDALFRLGWLYQTQLGDMQRALDAYTQALQLNLDHMAALNNIGIVFDDLGDKQQAIFYYNQALPLLRDAQDEMAEIRILNRIGSLYNEIGDVQQALSFYNRSLPLTMEVGDVAAEALTRSEIALIHKDLGDLDIAEEEMAKVISLAETAGLPSLEQAQQALEEIQALGAEQTPAAPVFRQRNR